MSALKWQVNSSSKFALFFIVMTHNSSVDFKVISFLFWTKESHQSPNFDSLSALVKVCQISPVFFQITSQFFLKISITLKCQERKLFCAFVAETTYTLVTRSQLKHKFLRLSSLRFKICEVPHVNFKATNQLLFNFRIILHCHDK